MVGVVVQSKFGRTRFDPTRILGAFRPAREKPLAPGAATYSVSHNAASSVPGDFRFALLSPPGYRVRIGAKDHSGGGRFNLGSAAADVAL